MRIQKQRYRHKPADGIYGDCHRTCIAMLMNLDRDEVPHFAHGDLPDWRDREREFLAEHGFATFVVGFGCTLLEVQEYMLKVNPGIFYILSGNSRTGVGHSVVAINDTIIADPSLDDAGIVGPMEDNLYWIQTLVPGIVVNRLNLPRPDLGYVGLTDGD